jgi:hypothetical protein
MGIFCVGCEVWKDVIYNGTGIDIDIDQSVFVANDSKLRAQRSGVGSSDEYY